LVFYLNFPRIFNLPFYFLISAPLGIQISRQKILNYNLVIHANRIFSFWREIQISIPSLGFLKSQGWLERKLWKGAWKWGFLFKILSYHWRYYPSSFLAIQHEKIHIKSRQFQQYNNTEKWLTISLQAS
jgi:hypothetical protein